MTNTQSNQTRPKFKWLFLAVTRANMKARPHREAVTAQTERGAALIIWSLYFVICWPLAVLTNWE